MSPGMLRARRRDVCIKPNRVLDKSSSRGMIYENEELRLRTININAEIERGQSELKKLRRENEHLKREIWSLREELDRLEALLRQKEQEEEEEAETDVEDEEEDEEGEEERPPILLRVPRVAMEPDGLSVVPEESEDGGSTPEPQVYTCINPERGVEEYNGALPPCIRLNCVHPFTAAATLPQGLLNVTVMEVIEACEKMSTGVVGVRLLEGSVYISAKGKLELEQLLAQGISIRGEQLGLQDVSQGTVVLALSAIPHNAKDQDILRLLSQFGPVIGGLERRMYKGADTGEGLARIRLLASLPKRLFLEGAEISVRAVCHEELTKLSMHPHTVSKQPSNLFVKIDRKDSDLEVKFSESVKTGTTSTKNEPFTFPAPSTSTSAPSTPKMEERSQSTPVIANNCHGSAQSLRPHSDTEAKRPRRLNSRRAKSPSSSSEQDSPTKPQRRRPSTVVPDRERSNSLSSRASYRRKMSMTGRETGKLPWCACWGNGCI
ncbi:unnamed protein product [Nezara viridula]|uniref:Uncharacterized protein n=1 Tax=Nezara viridula TaxID=85310 RepID=A0A9P0EC26_NEZVI|nr:unnamed protein product [Nezara viridula]